ncbi:MAG: type II secretion system protein [bacterium]
MLVDEPAEPPVKEMNRSRPASLSRARPDTFGRRVAVSSLFAARRGLAIRGLAIRGLAIRGLAIRGLAIRGLAIRGPAIRGFTILELLVVISIVTILTAVLMPTLAKVREAGERVQCASNMRQVACALIDYTDDHRDRLPTLNYTSEQSIAPRFGEAMALSDDTGRAADGLGRLILGQNGGYLSDPRVLYCPCHRGDHPFSRYEAQLMTPTPFGYGETVFCNYHYRGTVDPVTLQQMPRQLRNDMVLLVDGLRTRRDFSHVTGTNRLRSDGSVDWHADTANRIYRSLPIDGGGVADAEVFSAVWRLIDNRPTPVDD